MPQAGALSLIAPPFAGMTRIRFDGCDLSRAARGTPVLRVYGRAYPNGAGVAVCRALSSLVMARRRRLTAELALLGVLALLVFPADSSALRAVFVALTASGPSPSVLNLPSGLYPVWLNQDTVTHTVAFANGRCSFQVAPGGLGQCATAFVAPETYAYKVDGTIQASIVVTAKPRAVTLTARSHEVERRAPLRLHGRVTAPMLSPPVSGPRSEPVIVLARPDRYHPFRRVTTVIARGQGTRLSWQLRVRPRRRTIFIARANSEPATGEYWAPAWSKSFRVAPHR
jgi:hypothetical protein